LGLGLAQRLMRLKDAKRITIVRTENKLFIANCRIILTTPL